jgi:hypothetical protein
MLTPRRGLAIILGGALLALIAVRSDTASVAGPIAKKREAWTTAHIQGSPEPPHPYRLAPAFPKLRFNGSLHITSAPGTDRLFVCEQSGKILSFPNRADVEKADLAIDVSKDLSSWKPDARTQGFDSLYGLTFHPKFAENRYCYSC